MAYYLTITAITVVLALFASSLVHEVESRLTRETFAESYATKKDEDVQGTKWAVLVAGSNGYKNYRHQADVCHAYQILKAGGLSDENIVVLMYDDIAQNSENPIPGTIINKPDGNDVYSGVPKDYTGEEVTGKNLLAVILGDRQSVKGGSGKVVNSGPNDQIFIYYADHGSAGLLAMPNGDVVYANDFIDTLKQKHTSGTYKSMVIYVEACESGSIFDGLLPEGMNIYVTTASNPTENSWATYCPGSDDDVSSDFHTCLGDSYSVAWMEDTDQNNKETETLQQQYEVVKERTIAGRAQGSHVMQYGDRELSEQVLSMYFGTSQVSTKKYATASDENESTKSTRKSLMAVVDQREADVLYLKAKFRRAPTGSQLKVEAKKALDNEISHRDHVDGSIKAIGQSLFGANSGVSTLNKVRPTGHPLVDDWDCLKSMVNTYQTHCGSLSTYGLKYMRAFANICNAGIHKGQLAQASAKACS